MKTSTKSGGSRGNIKKSSLGALKEDPKEEGEEVIILMDEVREFENSSEVNISTLNIFR